MKKLKQYISEGLRLSICDEVKVSVCESLRIGIDDKPYEYAPTTWLELRKIIFDRYDELGPGTPQKPINFNDIDVSGMTTFFSKEFNKGLFEETKFEYIDISEWDVSNVEDMSCTFWHCSTLKSVGDISKWNISNVKCMNSMFRNTQITIKLNWYKG